MFGQLFIKECRQTARSLIYWLIVLVLIFDFVTQLGEMDIAREPKKGQENYGMKMSDDKDVIMETTLGGLTEEYLWESYTTYPIGFYKNVTLDKKEDARIGKIIYEATGIKGRDNLEKIRKEWYAAQEKEIQLQSGQEPGEAAQGMEPVMMQNLVVKPAEGLTYKRFEELMNQADDILGGGSNYAEGYRKKNARVPKTYEDAMAEYHELIEKDRLTGGYARLFSDYMVIFLGLVPVFLAVTRSLRDKRASMNELIYVRRCPSAVIIASRYLSMLVMILIPVFALSMVPLAQCMKHAMSEGILADPFAFAKYILGWQTPTIMIALSVGTFLTELTDTALAVLVQGAWWFVSLFGGTDTLAGGIYGWNLLPRHNTELNWEGYQEGFARLASNRILYTSLAVILIALTVIIYGQKRKGRYQLSWKNIGRSKK